MTGSLSLDLRRRRGVGKERDLKVQNTLSLTGMYVSTIFLIGFVHRGVDAALTVSSYLNEQVLIVGAITVFGGLWWNSLPNNFKYPLVYWRYRNVLSGHRCRRICNTDPRSQSGDLELKWPMRFFHGMKESERNAYWYNEIFRRVRNEPRVVQAHRSYLLYRDAAVG